MGRNFGTFFLFNNNDSTHVYNYSSEMLLRVETIYPVKKFKNFIKNYDHRDLMGTPLLDSLRVNHDLIRLQKNLASLCRKEC